MNGQLQAFLAVLVGVPLYALSLYVWPYRPCTRCDGTGVNPGSNSSRWGNCKKCKGTRHQYRLGARAVHRAVLAVRGRRER